MGAILVCTHASSVDPVRTVPFKPSDVCFITEKYWEGPFVFDAVPYQDYGATVQSWGGWPWEAADVAQWQTWIQSHHNVGILYDSTVNMVTPMPYGLFIHPELQDAACLDIEGNKIVVPYISDTWMGIPAYWCCVNNPVFQDHLVDRVAWSVQAGADGIHLDDTPAIGLPIMLWQQAGCFDDWCNNGFRQWLDDRYTTQELSELDISDISTYDYRATVQAIASTSPTFIQAFFNGQIPLSVDYHLFQLESAAAMVRTLKDTADTENGSPLPVSGNLPYLYPYTLKPLSALDSLVTENHFDPATNEMPDALLKNYKLSDALDKTMVSVPSPDSFTGVDGKWGLYKLWIAHAYALGQNLVSPDFVAWLPGIDPPAAELGPFYQFVRAYADLFDDYEPVEQVGVLYSNFAASQAILDQFGWYVGVDEDIASPVCGALFEANIAFGVAAAGDDFLDHTLTEEELSSRFELLVVPQGGATVDPAGGQQALVDQWLSDGRAILWNGDVQDVLDEITPQVVQEPTRDVWVLPRTKADTPGAPIVVHIVNHSYSGVSDNVTAQTNVTVELNEVLLDAMVVSQVTAYSPETGPVVLPFAMDSGTVSVTIPEVQYWKILKIERSLDGGNIYADFEAGSNGIGTPSSPFDNLLDAVTTATASAVIHLEPGASTETFPGGAPIAKALTLQKDTPAGGPVIIGVP